MYWKSIQDVIAANKKINNHWFDADTMAFFKCKIETDIINGCLFITSEKPPHDKRGYAIRCTMDDGRIKTVGSVCQYPTKKEAMQVIQAIDVDAQSFINNY